MIRNSSCRKSNRSLSNEDVVAETTGCEQILAKHSAQSLVPTSAESAFSTGDMVRHDNSIAETEVAYVVTEGDDFADELVSEYFAERCCVVRQFEQIGAAQAAAGHAHQQLVVSRQWHWALFEHGCAAGTASDHPSCRRELLARYVRTGHGGIVAAGAVGITAGSRPSVPLSASSYGGHSRAPPAAVQLTGGHPRRSVVTRVFPQHVRTLWGGGGTRP